MKPARFPGHMGYRRYGTNWTVLNDRGQIAATAEGNPWAFRTRKETAEYLQNNKPVKWLDPVNV